MVACGRLPNAEDGWPVPAISSSRLIGSARFSEYQMPNSESAIFVGIAAAAIGEFWEPRDGQQNTDPLSWSFSLHGAR